VRRHIESWEKGVAVLESEAEKLASEIGGLAGAGAPDI
jgi:hypothetical protein